jgi:SulP family sulfate permease
MEQQRMSPVGTLMPEKYKDLFNESNPLQAALQDALAGFTTGLAALSDAIAVSFMTGVSPQNAMWGAVIMSFTTALLGDRPGMVSSTSVATALILANVSQDEEHGMGLAAFCVLICGGVQLLCGTLRLSRFVTLIPHPVMLGFVNGVGILMIQLELRQFRVYGYGPWVGTRVITGMVLTGLVTITTALLWRRIPCAAKVVPAPLIAILAAVAFSFIMQSVFPRRTLIDVAGENNFHVTFGNSSFPAWDFPPKMVDWSDHMTCLKAAGFGVRMAFVGLLESLMTQAMIDQITSSTSSMRRQCFAQGLGNIVASLFGCQGGSAVLHHSLLNTSSGGHSCLSGVVMSLTLLLSVVFLAPVMGEIPVAAFIGLVFLITLNTFAWSCVELVMRINWVDLTVVVGVTLLTIMYNLEIGIFAGVVVSGCGFAWSKAIEVRVDSVTGGPGRRVFHLHGPLFFGSAMNYRKEIDPPLIPEDTVILDFNQSRILDMSGIDAINKTREYLMKSGKRVILTGVPQEAMEYMPDCAKTEETPRGENDAIPGVQ